LNYLILKISIFVDLLSLVGALIIALKALLVCVAVYVTGFLILIKLRIIGIVDCLLCSLLSL